MEVNISDELDLEITKIVDRDKLLAEAKEIILFSDVELGIDIAPKELEKQKAEKAHLLEQLEKEQASFSKVLQVSRLMGKDFEERGIKPSRDLKSKMRYNNFYQVKIPITLFPLSGWAFTRLDCRVEFCPNETEAKFCPIIYEIFPDDVWSEIFKCQNRLDLKLDGNLQFRAKVDDSGLLKKLSGKAQAKVLAKADADSQFVLGPFNYSIKRPEIRSRGKGNSFGHWRLVGQEYVEHEDLQLHVILMVPKERTQSVNVTGVLQASHDFQIWSADIFKDYWKYFDKKLRSFFEKEGAGISHIQEWNDITR
ncbi:MAG: hypothetical protein VSS75_019135 [Candidatus Parabeggiatoa sp.]|nr:hypothetical protein [Candidatus Parabeggiatoa sp.]